MHIVAIVGRRLREGVTYEEFRRAWFHNVGFGAANRMLTMLNVADPREVIVIAITDTQHKGTGDLLRIDQELRAAQSLDELIEPEISRTFGILVAEDDFSAEGTLEYKSAMVSGLATDLDDVRDAISSGRWLAT